VSWVRILYITYLVVIGVGLVAMTVVGLLGR
jgi:hypothetical protein